jgi:hypothetical protein
MSNFWDELSADLSREPSADDFLRNAMSATAERLRDYSRLVYTEPYNAQQRQEVEDHIARLEAAVRELVEIHANH